MKKTTIKTKTTKTKNSIPKTKPAAEKPKPTGYTRVQSIADVVKRGMKQMDDIIAKADALYAEKTGRASNQKETKWAFGMVRQTLVAFGLAEVADGECILRKGSPI